MNKLVAQYHGALLKFFHQHAQSHWDAEELTQEVFCKLMKRNDIDESRNQEAYLYTVAWSVLRDKVRADRSRQRNQHVEFDDDLSPATQIPVDQVIDSKEQYRRFVQVLNQLNRKTRDIFILNRYEGATYSEISKHFAISTSSVEKHMMKALTFIKKGMKES